MRAGSNRAHGLVSTAQRKEKRICSHAGGVCFLSLTVSRRIALYYDQGEKTDAEHRLWMTAHVPLVGHAPPDFVPLIGRRSVPSTSTGHSTVKQRETIRDWRPADLLIIATTQLVNLDVLVFPGLLPDSLFDDFYVFVTFIFGLLLLLMFGVTLCLLVTFVTAPFWRLTRSLSQYTNDLSLIVTCYTRDLATHARQWTFSRPCQPCFDLWPLLWWSWVPQRPCRCPLRGANSSWGWDVCDVLLCHLYNWGNWWILQVCSPQLQHCSGHRVGSRSRKLSSSSSTCATEMAPMYL